MKHEITQIVIKTVYKKSCQNYFQVKLAPPRDLFYKPNFPLRRRISLFHVNTWAKFVSPFEAKDAQTVADEIFRMDLGQEGQVDQCEVKQLLPFLHFQSVLFSLLCLKQHS